MNSDESIADEDDEAMKIVQRSDSKWLFFSSFSILVFFSVSLKLGIDGKRCAVYMFIYSIGEASWPNT